MPDCLAARLPGTLRAIEEAVASAEAAPSLANAADALRRDAVHLPGAMRWPLRRVRAVHGNLTSVRGLWPDRFLKCAPEVVAFRERLATVAVLVGLRGRCERHLAHLAPPLGFCPDAPGAGPVPGGVQHEAGPDPPTSGRQLGRREPSKTPGRPPRP